VEIFAKPLLVTYLLFTSNEPEEGSP
jgi:hypothetical protein